MARFFCIFHPLSFELKNFFDRRFNLIKTFTIEFVETSGLIRNDKSRVVRFSVK